MFSCHLVEHDSDLTLIDTNFAGSASRIAEAIVSTGKPLARILITHAHSDHVGSLDALAARYPEAEVVASERTAALLAGDRSLRPEEAGMKLSGGYKTTLTKPTRLIEDGEVIAGFRAVFTPGHAVGHVSYLHEDSGQLFAGDALISVGGLHVTGVWRLRFPFTYFSTADRAQALASARRIQSVSPSVIRPVHGPAVMDPENLLARAIEEAEAAFAR